MASPVKRGLLALPPPARAALLLIAIQLGIGSAFRAAFWSLFRTTAAEVPARDWWMALYLGLKFDLRLAVWVCLPFLLLALVPALDAARSRLARQLWQGYFVIVQAALILFYFVDIGYYGYLHKRLDAESLDLMASPAIALGMVWETYPVLRGAALLLLLAVGYAALIRKTAFRFLDSRATRTRGWPRRLAVFSLVAACALGVYGKWSWYPLRWSDAYFGTDPFVSALALNPVLFFIDSFPDRQADYDLETVTASHAELATLLEAGVGAEEGLSLARIVTPATAASHRPNLVVIHLESFATYKAGAYGNGLGATPNFDAIAADSLFFTNFFVPSGPTARAIFTMVTGIPDLNPVRSASRNPRAVEQHTILNALDGYEKYYFLGGSATWGNIRGLMAHNIEDLQIYEEGSYDSPRGDVWGISDLDLFEVAHEVLSDTERPFFAFIQTAGNHRPYTIPEDRGGFQLREVAIDELTANGFEDLASFNGLRFLDHALGRFFELARRKPYFKNTVFALYGDHGGPSPRATPWDAIGLTTNHVPGVLHAPGLVPEGRRIHTVASLVDLLPTAFGLMKVPYVNTTLGRDALADRPPERRFALLADGLITDRFLLRVGPRQAHLYAYQGSTPAHDLGERFPEERERLRGLHRALDQTARYLLFHNARRAPADRRDAGTKGGRPGVPAGGR